MAQQHIPVFRRNCQPALAIQIKLRSSLKHRLTLRPFTHKNPLFSTLTHYIEKYGLSQAEIRSFSLYDKELARKAKVNNLSLINNELHKQANVVYENALLRANRRKRKAESKLNSPKTN
jgi:hypothetical protein